MASIKDQIIKLNFEPIKQLSSGKFGEVWKAKDVSSGCTVIIKQGNNDLINSPLYHRLNTIDHPALITKTRLEKSETHCFIIREYHKGQSLKEMLSKSNRTKKSDQMFWLKAYSNLLDGLNVLHQNNVLHLDIKPSNLIVSNKNGDLAPETIKLVDFEQATFFPIESNTQRRPFALGYSPPEQLLNCNHLATPATDLFALAVSLYEVLTHKKGFLYHDPEMMMHLQLNLPLQKNNRLTTGLYDLLSKATARQPFPLPPSRLSKSETENIIQQGIQKRFQSSMAFKQCLEKYISQPNDHRTNWFEKLFNKHSQKH